MSLQYNARIFATAAHAAVGQKRKYTGEPYIVHPRHVVDILLDAGIKDEKAIAAAWLHDVVEDTQVTLDDIGDIFGPVVKEYVYFLTDELTPEDGNRAYRKRKYAEKLAGAPDVVQSIKVADMISNTSTITEHDADFAKVHMKEKQEMLQLLVGADKGLLELANETLAEYFGSQS